MRVSKGVLYEHSKRPEWGVGMLLATLDGGKLRMNFASAGEKTLIGAEHLRRAKLDGLDDGQGPTPKQTRQKQKQPRTAENDPRMWSDETLRRAVELAEAGTALSEIAAAVGKTANAVRCKLRALGIHVPVGEDRAYTEDEERIVREGCAAGLTDEEIAAKLPRRSVTAVHQYRQRLGLLKPKPNEWTAERVAELERRAGESLGELAAAFGRSRTAIRMKLRKLGLRGGG